MGIDGIGVEHVEVLVELLGIEIVKRRRLAFLAIAYAEGVLKRFAYGVREIQARVCQHIAMQIVIVGQVHQHGSAASDGELQDIFIIVIVNKVGLGISRSISQGRYCPVWSRAHIRVVVGERRTCLVFDDGTRSVVFHIGIFCTVLQIEHGVLQQLNA